MNKTIELLQKLINHEKSARSIGNLAEAEAFASRIQELLFKHKIEMTDVEFSEQEKNEPIAEDFLNENDLTGESSFRKSKQSWVGILLGAAAKANFCDVIGAARGNSYYMIGRDSDKQIARQLFKYLYDICIEVVETELSAYRASMDYAYQIADKSPASVSKRLTADRDEARKKLKAGNQQGGNEAGLIRLDHIVKAVEDFKDKAHPHVHTSSVSTRGHHGYERGKAYGSAVGLSSTPRLKG